MTLQRTTIYLGFGVAVAMVTAVLAVAISEVHSFDVFWQLQNGRYMAETHQLIYRDTFTLASEVPRYEHTWLHSLILFLGYSLAGYSFVSVLKGLLVFATACVLMGVARLRDSSWAALALVFPVYLLTSGGWLERPQIWSFLCFALFLWGLERHLQTRTWHVFWLLAVVLFWTNVHAASVLALALVSAYLVGGTCQDLLQKQFNRSRLVKLGSLLAGTFVAGLINPYPDKWLKTLSVVHKIGASTDSSGKATGSAVAVFNMDWTPTTFQQEPLFFYALGVTLAIVLLGWRRIKLSDLCLLAGLALMGLKLVRHIPFFYMGLVAILPAYLDGAVEPLRKRLPTLGQDIGKILVLVVALGLFGFYWRPLYNTYGLFQTGLRDWHYPIAATEFVRDNQLAKNLYNTYDWGGYMAFKLFPDYLMFWDGRQNSAEMFQLGWNVMAGRPDWDEILDRFEVKTIVTRASTIDTGQKYPLLDRLAQDSNWHLVLNTESSLVFVKEGSMPKEWLWRHVMTKERIDDTVLSEAHLMVKYNPNRYMAWWSMAEIYAQRKQYSHALFAVRQHIARAPQVSPAAQRLERQLSALQSSSPQGS